MTERSRQPARPATMTDVAKVAGVALKTVSRVINNEPHVSATVRAKVEEAIRQLDYVPDSAARSLAGARSFILGVLFDNPSPNYTMKVQAGVYRACIERQYHMRIDSIDSSAPLAALQDQLRALLRHGRVDGFVLTPPLSDNPHVLDFLDSCDVRYSLIAPAHPGRAPAVIIDDARAGEEVADMLWQNGHRRFGLLKGPESHMSAFRRGEGFKQRLRELDPEVSIVEAESEFEFEKGIAAGREILSSPCPPTAIFAENDDSAAGLIVACSLLGLAVPEQVSVCGFDDSWVARVVWPYLTTVNQPIEAMAYTAACLLLDRKAPTDPHPVVKLEHAMVERDSVARRPD